MDKVDYWKKVNLLAKAFGAWVRYWVDSEDRNLSAVYLSRYARQVTIITTQRARQRVEIDRAVSNHRAYVLRFSFAKLRSQALRGSVLLANSKFSYCNQKKRAFKRLKDRLNRFYHRIDAVALRRCFDKLVRLPKVRRTASPPSMVLAGGRVRRALGSHMRCDYSTPF